MCLKNFHSKFQSVNPNLKQNEFILISNPKSKNIKNKNNNQSKAEQLTPPYLFIYVKEATN